MTASAAQKKASNRYDRENTRQILLKLNLTNAADILEKLDETENRQGYVKSLIRNDICGREKILSLDAMRLLVLPVAKKYGIKKIYLFGSYARGEASPESDIDLMIEGGCFRGVEGYLSAAEAFQKSMDKPVDLE